MRFLFLLTLLLGLGVGPVRAEMVELQSCTEADGRTVPGVADPSLDVLVRSGLDGGHRVIRYNPELLPRLSAAARQFFFAQECAKLGQGVAPGAATSPARARQADCIGVAVLQASGALGEPAALQALQDELVFSPDEWAQLPGPRRPFNLTACPPGAAIALPLATPPTANQLEWDACIRGCGDRLFRCRDDGCLDSFRGCEAACKGR